MIVVAPNMRFSLAYKLFVKTLLRQHSHVLMQLATTTVNIALASSLSYNACYSVCIHQPALVSNVDCETSVETVAFQGHYVHKAKPASAPISNSEDAAAAAAAAAAAEELVFLRPPYQQTVLRESSTLTNFFPSCNCLLADPGTVHTVRCPRPVHSVH